MTDGGVLSLDDHLDGRLVPHAAEDVFHKHTSKTTAINHQAGTFCTCVRRTRTTILATYTHEVADVDSLWNSPYQQVVEFCVHHSIRDSRINTLSNTAVV